MFTAALLLQKNGYILHSNVLHCYVGNYNVSSLQSSDACALKGLLHTEPVTGHYVTLHCTTLHHTTSHHIMIHYITSYCITSHQVQCVFTAEFVHQKDCLTPSLSPTTTLHYITSHHIHFISLLHIISSSSHHITSNYITSHQITLHHITSHHITIQCAFIA